MRSVSTSAVFLLLLSAPLHAGKFENTIKNRWLGAWVLTDVETYSDCSGGYTDNRVNGDLVRGRGFRFRTGELARLDRLDVKRSRIDVRISLVEPLLVSYSEGPFTLYRERHCRAEIELAVPRERIKKKDVRAVTAALERIFERHGTQEAAQDSQRWNEREREPYPDDYDRTLAELAAWKAERHNHVVQAQLDRALELRDGIPERIRSDLVYLSGFARGLEQARAQDLAACSRMIALDLAQEHALAPETEETPDAEKELASLGFTDGLRLVWSQTLVRGLPGCFLAVPYVPEARGPGDPGTVSTSAAVPGRD